MTVSSTSNLFVFFMKRLLTVLILISAVAFSAIAKTPYASSPRSMGFRIGATGFDASYQHVVKKNQFLQGDLGIDFGYSANGHAGVRATATYNFIWARPAWTSRGYWAIYSGPGLTLGYVNDMFNIRIGDEIRYTPKRSGDNGFMLALAAQVGLEYTFDFPMSLGLEVRPVFGIHVNDGVEFDGVRYSQTSFYDNGLLGFVPTLAVRYRF